MGVDIDQAFKPYYGGLSGDGYHVGLSDAGVVFQQIQNLPSSTDEIARIAGLPQNPLTGELKTAGDKLLGEIKNTALNVGKKILKGAVSTGVSAVTSLTVGASIGNLIPIPGIGAAIGAIGALVWEGLKALGKALLKAFRPKPQPYQRKCKKFDGCPQVPQMAVVDIIPFLAPKRVTLNERAAKQLQDYYCGYGGVQDCLADVGHIWREAAQITLDTIPYLGLPQVERLLVAYRNTPSQFKQLNKRNEIEFFSVSEPSTIVYHLEWRKKKLMDLVARGQQVNTMAIGMLPVFQWDLGKELGIAASQVQISQSPETLAWFKTLGDFSFQARARDAAQNAAAKLHTQQIQQRAAVVAADPRLKMKHDLDIARMQCGDGNQAKCEEARRLMASLGMATGPAAPPGRTTPTTTPQQQGQLHQLAQARNKYVLAYLQRMSAQGNTSARALMQAISQEPNLTMGNVHDKTYAYLDRVSKTGNIPAKIFLDIAVKDFSAGVQAAQAARR